MMSEGIEKTRCRRCHRLFTITKDRQEYGPKCSRKNESTHIEVRNKKGEVVAVIV